MLGRRGGLLWRVGRRVYNSGGDYSLRLLDSVR